MQMNGRYVTFVLDEIYRVQKIQIWHFGFNFAVLHSVFTLMKSVLSKNLTFLAEISFSHQSEKRYLS